MKTTPTNNNNFVNYLIILLGFFVILFFTKNLYSDLQVALDTKEQKTSELASKEQNLAKLNSLEADLEVEGSEALSEIQAFLKPVNEEDILNYIYSYARDVNLGSDRIIIRNLSVTEWVKSDTWFLQANITISALISSEKTLFSFIDYLVDTWAEYRFFLSNFDYPMNKVQWNIQAEIPLTIYYK